MQPKACKVNGHSPQKAAHSERDCLGCSPQSHPKPVPLCSPLTGKHHHAANGGDSKTSIGDAEDEYIKVNRPVDVAHSTEGQQDQREGRDDAAAANPKV